MEIVLRVQIRFGIFCQISRDVLDQFLQSFHHMKALYMLMMDLYLILQFVKGIAMATNNFAVIKVN